MSPGSRNAIGLALAAATFAGAWVAVATGKPTVRIRVDGRPVAVDAGTTATQAARHFGIEPHAGDLLDVDGRILRPGRFPGRLLVDGRPATGSTTLRDGDRLVSRDGADHTEPLERSMRASSFERRPDPQFYVEALPGRSVEVRGALSHELVSTRFVPDGPAVLDDEVALTFDDGPSIYTPRFVALLQQLHVPATFFVIGDQAAEFPAFVKLEEDASLAIGDHTWSHPWRTPFADLPHTEIRSEIDHGEAELRSLGVQPALFRPPGGTVSPFVLRTAAAGGMHVVLWSVDSRDWVAGTTADEIVQRVLSAVQPGSIVIMHDGGGDREATLEALPRIVAGIRRRGLGFVELQPVG